MGDSGRHFARRPNIWLVTGPVSGNTVPSTQRERAGLTGRALMLSGHLLPVACSGGPVTHQAHTVKGTLVRTAEVAVS